jgi:hypothetical protein
MAARFLVEVQLPNVATSWQPAMVRKVGREVMVEVHRYKNRVRIVPGFENDNRAQLLWMACRNEGVEQACLCWEDIKAEWEMHVAQQFQPGWMQELRARAVRMAKEQRQPVSR